MKFSHALATRPEPQQAQLVQGLEDLGLEVISLPAFRFEAPEAHEAHEFSADLRSTGRHALLIFTSPRAVAFGLRALGGGLPEGARAAAIGPATRAALAAQGIEALQAPGARHDSEALLALLDQELDQENAPARALILAAPGGREALQRGLIARGWEVTLAPVYQRVSIAPDDHEAGRLEEAAGVLSLWTSGTALAEVLGGLSRSARQAVLSGTAIVASARLATLAEARGFHAVVVAGGASNAALLETAAACLGDRNR